MRRLVLRLVFLYGLLLLDDLDLLEGLLFFFFFLDLPPVFRRVSPTRGFRGLECAHRGFCLRGGILEQHFPLSVKYGYSLLHTPASISVSLEYFLL